MLTQLTLTTLLLQLEILKESESNEPMMSRVLEMTSSFEILFEQKTFERSYFLVS